MKKIIFLFATIVAAFNGRSQSANPVEPRAQSWYFKDHATDKYYGLSLDKAYFFVQEKKLQSKKVIVAVIDTGVDTTHEDLKPNLWRNPKEIPGNGKDDDKNGYMDDINGWNFLGGRDGRSVNGDWYESERMYFKLRQKYDSTAADTAANPAEYKFWLSLKNRFDGKYTPPIKDHRWEIVRDNESDISDRFYGNNDVMGRDPFHGTHVAGIIAAARNNNKGMDGIATEVQIMVIHAVPNGDEHDKDIALAIRYAVDNGAQIINMSFGKDISPQKSWVDEAVKYAESKNVLLVHGAGNAGQNSDSVNTYPISWYSDGKRAGNWINVGASSNDEKNLAATFSNYGKTEVDVFAPGIDIYSTVPGGNKYENAGGTSMASPVVAGTAAFLLSYFPKLSAVQLKYCIEHSVTVPTENMKRPGSEEMVSIRDLCKTGGIVNAFEAIKLAYKINSSPNTQGIIFESNLSWEEVKVKAGLERKFIFVNLYSSDCSSCDVLKKNVFSVKDVGEYFNDHFISVNVRADRNKSDNAEIKKWYDQAGKFNDQVLPGTYPCMLFYHFNGNPAPLNKILGTISADKLIEEAKNAQEENYSRKRYDLLIKQYAAGKKESFFLRDIAMSGNMLMLDKSELMLNRKISDEYIAGLNEKELYTRANIGFLRISSRGTTHPGVTKFINHEKKVNDIMGLTGYAENHVAYWIQIEEIPDVFKPEYKPDWEELYSRITQKYNTQYADRAIIESKIDYYASHDNKQLYLENAILYLKKYGNEDWMRARPETVNDVIQYMLENNADKNDLQMAFRWSDRLVHKPEVNTSFYSTHANLLEKLGRKAEAGEWKKKSGQ